VPYKEILVSSATGDITVTPDETTYGFTRGFNISCEDADGDPVYNAHVYVMDIEHVFEDGSNQTDDDVTFLGHSDSDGWLNFSKDIDEGLKFLESGTATFMFILGGTYEDFFGDDADEDAEPSMTAETEVIVNSPDPVNIFITYAQDKVLLCDVIGSPSIARDPPRDGEDDDWGNYTSTIIVEVYADNEDEMLDANITITGCGVDVEWHGEEQPDDGYEIPISPRFGGIMEVEVYNEDEEFTTTEDIEVEGLQSTVTTSIGDDKKITVETMESITFKLEEIDGTDLTRAEVHVQLFDYNWDNPTTINVTIGDFTEGNGLLGEYIFYPDEDYLDELGYLLISAKMGYDYGDDKVHFYSYDVVEIEPNHDLVVIIIEPDQANRTLTAGLEYDLEVEIENLDGDKIRAADMGDYNNDNKVMAEILNEDGDVLYTITSQPDDPDGWEPKYTDTSKNVWVLENWRPPERGTLLISAYSDSGKHHGNNSEIDIEYAELTYVPDAVTCGIGLENVTVEVYAVDALGNVIDNEKLYFNKEGAMDTDIDDDILDLDDGMVELELTCVGNYPGEINATFLGVFGVGVNTTGKLIIDFPRFVIEPAIAYVGIANDLMITAYDLEDNLLPGINISLTPSVNGTVGVRPDPVETDEDGIVQLTIEPAASGTLNVTLCFDIEYNTEGRLEWTELLTYSTIEVTTKKPLDIAVSQSPIFEGDTLTVTVTTEGTPVADVDVQFGQETKTTGSDGKATFTAPNPGVESAVYIIEASKFGYISDSLSITVIKVWQITIIGPSEMPSPGEEFTITIIAKGSPLAGATITFDGITYSSGGDGKVTLKAPEVDEEEEFTIIATFDPYIDGTLVITIAPGGIPGFELLALLAALGVAFILLRRRR
jgi:uncharacterized GH25 family protein